MPKVLSITVDRVKEAASKCGTARETLKVLFPEAFEPEWVEVPYTDITVKPDHHAYVPGWNQGFDLHLHHKDSGSIGFITFRDGKVGVNVGDSTYRVEVNTGAMTDGAMLFHVMQKA